MKRKNHRRFQKAFTAQRHSHCNWGFISSTCAVYIGTGTYLEHGSRTV